MSGDSPRNSWVHSGMSLTVQNRPYIGTERGIVFVLASINTLGFSPHLPGQVRRHFSLVLDTSGSMSEHQKLDHVKIAAAETVSLFGVNDDFSLIAFSDEARVLHRMAGTPEEGRQFERQRLAAQAAIEKLRPDGNTNFCAGLQLAWQEFRASDAEEGFGLFLSDGLNNRDLLSLKSLLCQLALERAHGARPFQVSCRRFGKGAPGERVKDLRRISDTTGGDGVRVITDLQQLDTAPVEWLANIRQLGIRDMQLLLQLSPGVEVLDLCQVDPTIAPLLIVPPRLDDGKQVVELGPWGNGQRQVLLKLSVPPANAGMSTHMGSFVVAYGHHYGDYRVPHEDEVSAFVNRTTNAGLLAQPCDDIDFALDRVNCTKYIDQGLDCYAQGDTKACEVAFGEAAKIAHRYGDRETLAIVEMVCEIADAARGWVRVRATQVVNDLTMNADSRSTSFPLTRQPFQPFQP